MEKTSTEDLMWYMFLGAIVGGIYGDWVGALAGAILVALVVGVREA